MYNSNESEQRRINYGFCHKRRNDAIRRGRQKSSNKVEAEVGGVYSPSQPGFFSPPSYRPSVHSQYQSSSYPSQREHLTSRSMSPSNQRLPESFNSDEHPTISNNIHTSLLHPRAQTPDSEHVFNEMTAMQRPFRSISPPRFRSSDQIAFSYPPSTYQHDPHARSTSCSNDSFSDMNTYQTPSTGHYSASPYPNRFQSSNDDNVLGQNSSMQHFSRSISPINYRYSESPSQTPSMCYVSQSPSSSISLYPDTRSVSLFTTYSQPSTSLSPVHWEPPASTPESSSASPEPISPNPYLPPPADATVDIPPPLTENDNHDEQSKTCKNLSHYCSRSISPIRKEANSNTTSHSHPFSLSVPPSQSPRCSANFSDMQSSTSHIDIVKHQTSINPAFANKSSTFSNFYTLTPLTSSDRAVSSLPFVQSTQNRLMASDTSSVANHHSNRPLSPLRYSTTVQFHSYDDVITTPSLITVERNRSLVDSLGLQQRQKEVSFQNITSITEWLFHMSSDDTLPKLDYNSTQLYSYPDQKSLDCVRQYAHKSIYPRPLFLSRKEDLDLNCKKGRTVEQKASEGKINHDNSIPVSETCSQTQSTATPLPFENEIIYSNPFMYEMEGESSNDDNDSIDDLVSQLAAIDDNTDETTSQENHVEINNELETSTSNVCEFNDTLTHTDNEDSEDWTNLRYVDKLVTLSKSKDKRENSESEKDQKTKQIPHFRITNKFVEGHQYSTAPFPSASACVSLHGLSKDALSSNRFVEYVPSPEVLNSSNNSDEICDANSKQQNETVMKVKRQRGRPKKKSALKRNTSQVKEINSQISNKDNLKVTGEKDVFEYVNSQETLQPRKAKQACTEKLLKVIGKKTKKTKKNAQCLQKKIDNSFDTQSNEDDTNCERSSNNYSSDDAENEDDSSSLSQHNYSSVTIMKNEKNKRSKSSKVKCSKQEKMKRKSVLESEENLQLIKQRYLLMKEKPKTINDIATTDDVFRVKVNRNELYGNVETTEYRPISQTANSSIVPALNTPRHCYDAPSTLSSALRTYSREAILPYVNMGAPYKKESERSHIWVYKMFTQFCNSMRYNAWPLEVKPVYGFLKFLGIALRYSMETINGSVIPGLYQISEYKTNEIVDDNVRHIVRRAKMEIYNALDEMFEKEKNESNKYGGVLNRSHKKEALIVGDLEIILSSMPDWVVEKPREASLFIFALSTGARAHTCSFVKLKDIVRVFAKEGSSFVKVTFNLAFGKGSRGDDHCVTLEGDLCFKHNLNFVWWFEEYLVQEFGISLTQFDNWNLGELSNEFVWGLRKGAMRVRIQKRARQAGYPEDLFAFHSFRSGFICSLLLKTGNKPILKESALETASYIGNWKKNSRSEKEYVKYAQRGTVVATRTGFPDALIESSEPFSEDLANPTVFHNISLKQSEWKFEDILDSFNFFVLQVIKFSCSRLKYPGAMVIKFNKMASKNYLDKLGIKKEKNETDIKASRRVILQKFYANDGGVVQLGQELLSTINEYLDGEIIFDTSNIQPKKKLREVRERNEMMNCPARIKWTRQEDEILMDAFLNGKGDDYLKQKLQLRSKNSCRDRLRNIVKMQKKANEAGDPLKSIKSRSNLQTARDLMRDYHDSQPLDLEYIQKLAREKDNE